MTYKAMENLMPALFLLLPPVLGVVGCVINKRRVARKQAPASPHSGGLAAASGDGGMIEDDKAMVGAGSNPLASLESL